MAKNSTKYKTLKYALMSAGGAIVASFLFMYMYVSSISSLYETCSVAELALTQQEIKRAFANKESSHWYDDNISDIEIVDTNTWIATFRDKKVSYKLEENNNKFLVQLTNLNSKENTTWEISYKDSKAKGHTVIAACYSAYVVNINEKLALLINGDEQKSDDMLARLSALIRE